MKYHVTLRSRTYVIDIDGGAVTVDGERLEAHWAAIPGTPLIHLLLGKDSWTVACQQLDGRGRKVAAGGVVKAPMPGLVVRVEVSEGKAVEVGEALVVVEAMKMENELRATYKGVVERIHVKAGDRVEKGAPLVTLSPQPSQPSG